MNTGQMLLVLGAMAILSLTSLTINTVLVGQTTAVLEAEAGLNAISIAQTMIDEIMTKAYDAYTVSNKAYSANSFTASNALGCNSTEASNVSQPDVATPFKSFKYYNDVDDYNNYTRTAATTLMGNFAVVDTVIYVVETKPDQKSNTQTYHKKVIVTVRHPNMSKPLQLSDIAVYRKYF